MKYFKYPIMLIFLIGVISVFFWDDVKQLFTKISNKMQVKFHSNVNNPFNLKAVAANKWNGKTTKEGATFESFDTLENGVRAGIKVLKTYFSKYNLNTVAKIIPRFAPKNENDTEGYIKFVCSELGVERNEMLSADKETLWELSSAVCKMENGYELSRQTYETAWQLL